MSRIRALVLFAFVSASAALAWTADTVWMKNLDGHSMSATGIFDLDRDSVPELLVSGNGFLYCYDTAGTRPSRRFLPGAVRFGRVQAAEVRVSWKERHVQEGSSRIRVGSLMGYSWPKSL